MFLKRHALKKIIIKPFQTGDNTHPINRIMDRQYSDYFKHNHEQKNPDTAQYVMYESSHQALKQDNLLLAERLSLGTVVTGRG